MQTLADLLMRAGWGFAALAILFVVAEALAVLTVPSVLIERRGKPVAALSWLLALLALPGVGVVAWWAIGRVHMRRRRRRKATARAAIAPELHQVHGRTATAPALSPAIVPILRLPSDEAAGLFPVVADNSVRILADADSVYPALERLVLDATAHVHVLMYQFCADEVGAHFRDLLAARARAGLEVRVLVDAVGSLFLTRRFMAPLVEAGGRFAVFMPNRLLRRSLTLNFRNHRKIVVADGAAAYTGGLNIGARYAAKWHDVGLLLAGPVVGQLQEVFAEDWFFTTGENLADDRYFRPARRTGAPVPPTGHRADCSIVASGPDTPQNITHDLLFIAIGEARERIFIATPYLAPGPAIMTALRSATYRGADVRLLVPRRSDVPLTTLAGRSFYPELLAAGVRIFEYLPAILHAKLWIFDRDLAVVGSANLDGRSFELNFESSCCVRSRAVNEELAGLFTADLEASEEITAARLEGRPRLQILKEAAANLLAPLL